MVLSTEMDKHSLQVTSMEKFWLPSLLNGSIAARESGGIKTLPPSTSSEPVMYLGGIISHA
jgi:hypothetical protein